MSNLIKSVYFSVDPCKARVIDSDEQIEEYIPTIYQREREEEEYQFRAFGDNLTNDEEAGEGYTDGLSVISMNDVVQEEREKLSKELEQEKEDLLLTARQEAEEIIEQAKGLSLIHI